MQEGKIYRQYAADCRRIATTMSKEDAQILLKMADAWDGRAEEADRRKAKATENVDHAGRDK